MLAWHSQQADSANAGAHSTAWSAWSSHPGTVATNQEQDIHTDSFCNLGLPTRYPLYAASIRFMINLAQPNPYRFSYLKPPFLLRAGMIKRPNLLLRASRHHT